MSDDSFRASLRRWASDSSTPGIIRREGIGLKRGKSFKGAVMSFSGGNPDKPSRRELTLRQVPRDAFGPGYDFDNPEIEFKLDGPEIEVLQKFLNGLLADLGHYVRVEDKEVADALAERFLSSGKNDRNLLRVFANVAENPDLALALASTPEALGATAAISTAHRWDVIDRLERLAKATEPATKEDEFQKIIQENAWLFGGRYISVAKRRNLTGLDQLDVPLIGVDGSLHVVELKRSFIPRLFKEHRDDWIAGNDIHDAVSQTENYLFNLDAEVHSIRSKFDLDVQRAFATVVVGHIDHCTTGITVKQASKVLRIYNSHLSRIRVMTYDQLIANARNAMKLGVAGAGDAV